MGWIVIEYLAHPWVCLLGLLVPLVCIVVWYRTAKSKSGVPNGYLQLPSVFPINGTNPEPVKCRWRKSILVFSFVSGFWGMECLILAAAGPYGIPPYRGLATGSNLYFVVDMSASMRAYDVDLSEIQAKYANGEPIRTRFEVARNAVLSFVSNRQKLCHETSIGARCDRIGVVLFGRSAYIDVPLTTDYQMLQSHLAARRVDDIDATQSAIGDGLMRAVASLRHSDPGARGIVLVTDGDRKGGRYGMAEAIQAANTYDVHIYPLMVGDSDDALLAQREPDGSLSFHTARFPIQEESLQKLAAETGGVYFRATDGETFLDRLGKIMDDAESPMAVRDENTDRKDLSAFFALIGLILAMAAALIYLTLGRRFP